jgi:hypothetical protein
MQMTRSTPSVSALRVAANFASGPQTWIWNQSVFLCSASSLSSHYSLTAMLKLAAPIDRAVGSNSNELRNLAAPGAIAFPYATSELARVDTQRQPDHELTPVLPA